MPSHPTTPALPANRGDEPAGRPIPEHPDALLYPAEAAYLRGQGVRTLESERLRGGGMSYIRLGRSCIRYRRRDLMAWITARERKSTSDPGPTPATRSG